MFRWFARFFLLRFLPRRLLPILTVVEIARIIRGLRRPKYAVNEPIDSRTAPPPRISSALEPSASDPQRGPTRPAP
jgi:hypothetical protein